MQSRSRYFNCAYNRINGCLCKGVHCENCRRFAGWSSGYVAKCKCNSTDCESCKEWISDKAKKLQFSGKSCKLCDECKRECKSKNRTYCNLFEPNVKEVTADFKKRINFIKYADAYRRKFYKTKENKND